MNGILELNWINIKSALIYGLLMAIFAMLVQIKQAEELTKVDWGMIVSSGVMALVTATISVIKNILTTDKGNFLGVVKVITPTEK